MLSDNKKKKITRVDRNTQEADVAERSEPYDEIGKTDLEIEEDRLGKKEKPKGLAIEDKDGSNNALNGRKTKLK